MTITINRIAILGLTLAVFGLFFVSTLNVKASAVPGLRAVLATSSMQVVGPQSINRLFATSTQCTSRVITTNGNAINISFDSLSSTSPSATSGHYQAASTTVAYDAGIYGCGLWSAYGFTASTSATLSEFQ